MTHLAAIILTAIMRDTTASPEAVAIAAGYTRAGAITALQELRRAGLVQVRRVYSRSIAVPDASAATAALRDISRPRRGKHATR